MHIRSLTALLALSLSLNANSGPGDARPAAIRSALARVPYHFEPNAGQFASDVRFLARAGNFALLVHDQDMVAMGRGAGFRMRFEKSEASARWTPGERLPGITNYFLGNDPTRWRTNVANYRVLGMDGIYPGIDARLDGAGRHIEYSFTIHPEAHPAAILLSISGAVSISPGGDLVIRDGEGEFLHSRPHAYQMIDGKRRNVAVSFRITAGSQVAFDTGTFDRSRDLIIDPVIAFHGFMGGTELETAVACTADPAGALYLAGWTGSMTFPTAGTPFRDFLSGQRDGFASKLHPSGTYFQYSTYIGGAQNDDLTGIAFDGFGNAYLSGTTFSEDFPVTSNASQTTYGGNGDALVLKLNPEGSRLTYGGYMGGSEFESGRAVAADGFGFATFVGTTASLNFPTRNANQPFSGGAEDMFIVKLHSNSTELLFSTYFGGDASDQANGVALDPNGDIYIAGRTTCSSLPVGATLGPVSGPDIAVIKWRSNGSSAAYIACIGGNATDTGAAIAVDRSGNAYVTGTTSSTNFPVVQGLQFAYGGALGGSIGDGFAFKLNAAGNALLYSTYLGGARDDWGYSITVDTAGSAYVAGATLSTNFPTSGGVTPPSTGARSGFVIRISPQGPAMQESFFFESIATEDQYAVSLDERGAVYVVGGALAGFRMPGAKGLPFRNFAGPIHDAFVAKLATARLQIVQDTVPATISPGVDVSFSQRLINRGPDDADSVTYRGSVPAGMVLLSCNAVGGTCSVNGNTYRVDLTQLAAGRGVEVNLIARANVGLPDGAALGLGSIAQSVTHDPNLADNSLVVNLFTSAGAACGPYTLPGQVFTVNAAAGSLAISVTTPFGCPWGVYTGTDWLSIESPAWMTGSGAVSLQFPANPLPAPRIASITIAGQRLLLLQRSAANGATFQDVPATHPFVDTIRMLRYLGVTSGCDAFNYCPDATTTRGQMAVFIVRSLLGGDDFTIPNAPYFTDVQGSHPQFRHIQKLRELGITAGCSSTLYCPHDPVTRSQMAAFLIRARLAVDAGRPFPFPNTFSFTDVPPSYPTYNSVQKMKEEGITSGCSASAYCPDDLTTRGQMSVFLMRAFAAP